MEVKGTAVVSLPLFIEENFGEHERDRWLTALSPQAREVFSGTVETGVWYPLRPIFIEPTRLLCDMFYEGDLRGAWACGMHSAEYALRGILKLFVKFGSPSFIVSRASSIFSQYYRPSLMRVARQTNNETVLHIRTFPEPDEVIESRICGWIEQALRIHGCKTVSVAIGDSLCRGDEKTEIRVSWRSG